MSFFPNKSREQIAALDSDAINRVIDFTSAERGVPVFLEAPVAPVLDCKPDIVLYQVGGEKFLSKAEAEKVAEFIGGMSSRVTTTYSGWDYSISVVTGADASPLMVHAEHAYSVGMAAQTKMAREEYKVAKQEYDVAAEVFKKNTAMRDEVVAEVMDEVSTARSFVWRINQLKAYFAKYINLANGDKAVAFRFLRQAQDVTDEQAEAIGAGEFIVRETPAEAVAEQPAEAVTVGDTVPFP